MKTPRRRHFILASVTSLSLIGALVSPAFAHAGKGDEASKRGGKIARMCEEIGCTDKQAEDIRAVMKQMKIDIEQDREAIQDLRKQLGDEWKSAKPDERKLTRIADKIAAHERNIADRRMEAMLELHPLLTAEQRERVADHLMKTRGKKRGGKKNKKAKKNKAKNEPRVAR